MPPIENVLEGRLGTGSSKMFDWKKRVGDYGATGHEGAGRCHASRSSSRTPWWHPPRRQKPAKS